MVQFFVDSFEEVDFNEQSIELFDSLTSLASAFTALKFTNEQQTGS